MRYLLILVSAVFPSQASLAQDAVVNTESREIDYQERKTPLVNNVYFSNKFEGARLNEIEAVNDTLIRITIKPENRPINPSQWYAFKVWSEAIEKTTIHLTYDSEDGFHRYYPKISTDGINWNPLDSAKFFWDPDEAPERFLGQTGDSIEFRTQAYLNITASPDTLWVAAQEVITSKNNETWAAELSKSDFVRRETIGTSPLDNPILKMSIGNQGSKKAVLVFSRQHPPEVTGYLAMRAFIEEIAGNSALAAKYRSEFLTMVFPMINPDGVDQGHWRHNTGGVDLNRDWANLHQPETRLISEHIEKYLDETGTKVYFGIDFHSTWKDIFYILDRDLDVIHITKPWLEGMAELLPEFRIVEKEIPVAGNGTSVRWFYNTTGCDGVTYEVGDDTDREYLKEKARAAAISLMKVLLELE